MSQNLRSEFEICDQNWVPETPACDVESTSDSQKLICSDDHERIHRGKESHAWPWWRRRSEWSSWRRRGLRALVFLVALVTVALVTTGAPPPVPAPAPPAALPLVVLTTAPATTLRERHLNNDHRIIFIEEVRADLKHRLLSLPLFYSHKTKDESKYFKKKDCAPFPSIYEITGSLNWQSMYSSHGVFHLYGAYMDARNSSREGPTVRVLAVRDQVKPTVVTHCQLWFEERPEPAVVRGFLYKYVLNNTRGNNREFRLPLYLLSCVLPEEVRHLIPASVSIVENACDRATNNLRVHYDRPDPAVGRKEFAVCVKGLDFLHEDVSVRLVEWIELIKIMGADKIFFYELQVHKNISKVLDYYKNQGTVTVTPITLPGGQPNLPGLQHMYLKKKTTHKRQMELIPYNDCLYRHMYEYRWLVLLDIDEVIVPLEDADWSSLMKSILPLSKPAPGKPPRTSYHASNLYFLDSLRHEHGWEESLPRYMHMLQHVYRTRNFTKPGQYVKAFHETDRVLALHNHFPLACLGGACSSYPLETRHARLQHYRADCVSALSKTCKELRAEPVRDTTLWRWREPLATRAEAVLKALGFLQPHR